MKIKRFMAKDMRDAIRQVREEQGPDAVILSNRRIDGQVEIVAATDYDEALVRQAIKAEKREPGTPKPPEDIETHAPVALPPDPNLGALREELTGLRRLVQIQTQHFTLSQLKLQPGRADALEQLDRIGVEPTLAQELVTRVPMNVNAETARRMPLGLLAKHLPVTSEDPVERGGVIALVGPTRAMTPPRSTGSSAVTGMCFASRPSGMRRAASALTFIGTRVTSSCARVGSTPMRSSCSRASARPGCNLS